jgi:hypothetical protein
MPVQAPSSKCAIIHHNEINGLSEHHNGKMASNPAMPALLIKSNGGISVGELSISLGPSLNGKRTCDVTMPR